MKNIIRCDNCGAYSDPASTEWGRQWVEYSNIFAVQIDKEKHFCSDECLVDAIRKRMERDV